VAPRNQTDSGSEDTDSELQGSSESLATLVIEKSLEHERDSAANAALAERSGALKERVRNEKRRARSS
jgi:hypothetical protein